MTEDIEALVAALAEELTARRACLAVAESCTGGRLAGTLTDRAGSSAWFERGFVTYSNAAKQEMLGVEPSVLTEHGAVSEAVAAAMARGALRASPAQLSAAITGVAGPGGGTAAKPVGTVWLGWATRSNVTTERVHFDGDREAVRRQSVHRALAGLLAGARDLPAEPADRGD